MKTMGKRASYGQILLWGVLLFALVIGASAQDSIYDDDDFCAVNAFMLFGQRATAVWMGTNNSAASDPQYNNSLLIDDGNWVRERLDENIESIEFGQPVLLVILDDFSHISRGDQWFEEGASHGMYVASLTWSWYREFMAERLAESGYPDLINQPDFMEQISVLIAAGELDQSFVPMINLYTIDISGIDDNYELVDKGFSTEYISGRMVEELGDYPGRMVVNMSWALVPCKAADFENFLEAHLADPGYSLINHLGESTVYQLLSQNVPNNDPFRQLVQNIAAGEIGMNPDAKLAKPALAGIPGNVLVASAGNFGMNVGPFEPATWPEVLSVSAGLGYDNIPWNGSSRGDVRAPGGFYILPGSGDFLLLGTSFSAPAVSLLMAFDQAKWSPTCGVVGNRSILATGSNEDMGEMMTEMCD